MIILEICYGEENSAKKIKGGGGKEIKLSKNILPWPVILTRDTYSKIVIRKSDVAVRLQSSIGDHSLQNGALTAKKLIKIQKGHAGNF